MYQLISTIYIFRLVPPMRTPDRQVQLCKYHTSPIAIIKLTDHL